MSKSILVINTPVSCRDCISRTLSDDCAVIHKSVAEHRYNKSKPDWCPLMKIPERYEPLSVVCRDFERGYNKCIDEILRNSR